MIQMRAEKSLTAASKIVGSLVVSGGQSPGVSELSEKVFLQIAIAVEESTERKTLSEIALGGLNPPF